MLAYLHLQSGGASRRKKQKHPDLAMMEKMNDPARAERLSRLKEVLHGNDG